MSVPVEKLRELMEEWIGVAAAINSGRGVETEALIAAVDRED